MTLPIQVSWFRDAFDAVDALTKSRTYTWPEFVADLAARLHGRAEGQDRRGLPMFVPAIWRASRRCKASVAAVTLGVLDLDGVPQSQVDAVCAALTPHQACIYSSPRDPMPDGSRKVRVIVAIDQAVDPSECKRLRRALAGALGVQFALDRSTETDESRGFFVGALSDSAPRQLWVSPGQAPVQVGPLLATVPAEPPRDLTAGVEIPDTGGEADEFVGRIDPTTRRVTAEYVSELMQPGQKNHLLYAFGGVLRQWGWSAEDAAEFAREALEHRSRTAGDVEDVVAGVETIVRGYFVDARHGWDTVKTLITEPHAQEIERCVPNRWRAAHEAITKAETPWLAEQQRQAEQRANERQAEQQATVERVQALEGQLADDDCGFKEVLPGDGKPLDQLIAGLDFVPRHGGAIAARINSAKSPTAIEIGLMLANGHTWHGRAVQKCQVLYMAAEKSFDLGDKRDRIARAHGFDPRSMKMLDLDEALNKPEVALRLNELVRRSVIKGKTVLFIDTYAAAVEGLEHNKSSYAEPLRKMIKNITDLGACACVILHAKKGDSAKIKAPGINDVEGSLGVGGAVTFAMGAFCPDEDDKTRVHYYPIRATRRDWAPFELRWVDVPDPNDPTNDQWGLKSVMVEIKPDAEVAKREDTPAELTSRVVKAATRYMTELCASQGVELRDDVIHTRSLSAVAEMIAKDCDTTSSKAAAAIEMCRVKSNVGSEPVSAFPFWGSGDQLNLRFTRSTPTSTFDQRGAGTQAPETAPPQAPPVVPSPQAPAHATALRSAVESAKLTGYDGPVETFTKAAGLPWTDDPITRRAAMTSLRTALDAAKLPDGLIKESRGPTRPAWLTIRPTGVSPPQIPLAPSPPAG